MAPHPPSVHLLPSERSIRICIHHTAPTIPTVPKQERGATAESPMLRAPGTEPAGQRPWSPRAATCAAATTSPCRAASARDNRDLGPRPEDARAAASTLDHQLADHLSALEIREHMPPDPVAPADAAARVGQRQKELAAPPSPSCAHCFLLPWWRRDD
jgi:hypothetical protein